jgi:gluconate 2-dehydrogenase gamma chain
MPEVRGGRSWSRLVPVRISRRHFLKGTGATAALAGFSLIGISCETGTTDRSPERGNDLTDPLDPGGAGPISIFAMPTPVPPETIRFFDDHQMETVEALSARLLPGDPDDPGAREAGVVYYIDNVLASGDGFAEPTYHAAPFGIAVGEDAPEDLAEDEIIWIEEDQLERYGFQSRLTPQESYTAGLAAVDRYAQERFGDDFVDLSENDQDTLIGEMADGTADDSDAFDSPTATSFFDILHEHTVQGLFCDPIYGGNRNMVGWRLVGYPGSQRGYTPTEMLTEGFSREPQSLAAMHYYHPGDTNRDEAVFPVVGSEPES